MSQSITIFIAFSCGVLLIPACMIILHVILRCAKAALETWSLFKCGLDPGYSCLHWLWIVPAHFWNRLWLDYDVWVGYSKPSIAAESNSTPNSP